MKNRIVLGNVFNRSNNRKHGEVYLNLKDNPNIFVKNDEIDPLSADSSWIQISPGESLYDIIWLESYKPNTIVIEVEPCRSGAWFQVSTWYYVTTEETPTAEETTVWEPVSQERYHELELFGIF